jgi:hypothetical protein
MKNNQPMLAGRAAWAVLALWALASCHPMPPSDTDDTLLKHVVEMEAAAFYGGNLDRWQQCYDPQSFVQWVWIENGKTREATDWPALLELAKQDMDKRPASLQGARSNFRIRHLDGAAWVYFDETQTRGRAQRQMRGVRMLEKVEGEWKITYLSQYEAPR